MRTRGLSTASNSRANGSVEKEREKGGREERRGEGERREKEQRGGNLSKLVYTNIPQLPVSANDSRFPVYVASGRICLQSDSENLEDVP